MLKIELKASTLKHSFGNKTEHLLSEYQEATAEMGKWIQSGRTDTEVVTDLQMELVDMQFMAFSLANLHRAVEAPKMEAPQLRSRTQYQKDVLEAWQKLSEVVIWTWQYAREIESGAPSRSEAKNLRINSIKTIIEVEKVLVAMGISEENRNKIRQAVYEKNRVRGYYD